MNPGKFKKWLTRMLRFLKTRFFVLSSLLILASPVAAHIPPADEPAIDRVDKIREQLLQHDDREHVNMEQIEQSTWYRDAQWRDWQDWRDWRDFPNYRRNDR
jgi:hypothetical protein